jgi:hypothetical protein
MHAHNQDAHHIHLRPVLRNMHVQIPTKNAYICPLPQAPADPGKRRQKSISGYEQGPDDLLTPEEYSYFVSAAKAATSNGLGHLEDRFAHDLICGEFQHAAKGIFKLLNVSKNEVDKRALAGVAAIEEEIRALGNRNAQEQLDYILHQPATEKIFHFGVRDHGHEGMRLQDFVTHPNARAAELEEAEVVALRLYTTSAFRQINDPLRDQERISKGEAHPLPVTVMFLIEGIKKLRAIDADTDRATTSMVLWRGMKNVRPTDHFAQRGGTEVIPGYIIIRIHTHPSVRAAFLRQ